MMSFWILAILLTAIALCYVLPPLLNRAEQAEDERERANVSVYRDQFDELERDLREGLLDKEQYEQGRLELQRRLLEDVSIESSAPIVNETSARQGRSAAMILAGGIPLLALILYYQITPRPRPLGQPTVSSAQEEETAEDAATGQPGMPTQQEIEGRVARLAERLKENPDDVQGWLMLARSYQNFKRYREAADAYARAVELSGNDAQVWVDYAEALALANDSDLQGKPLELINKALQLNPKNEKALWLAGNAAFQAQNFQQAVSYWEQLQKLLPPNSEGARAVSTSIEEARARIKP